MNNFLAGLMNITSLLNPILVFCLLISAIAFLVYLKQKSEVYFESIKRIAIELERIANILSDKKYY